MTNNGNHHNTRHRTITKQLVYLLATMCRARRLTQNSSYVELPGTPSRADSLSEKNLARRAAAVAEMHAKVNITFTSPPCHTTWHSTQLLLILLAALLIVDHSQTYLAIIYILLTVV